MRNHVPVDYEAVLAGMGEQIDDLTMQVTALSERVVLLEARESS